MILPVLTSFRLDNIMILQKGSTEIRNLFSGTIWVSLFFTVLLIAGLLLVKSTQLVSLDLTYFVLLLCGAGAVLTAWNNTQNSLFTKFRLFNQMSTAFVLSSLFSVIFQAIFYFLDFQSNGLIYGWLVGLTASFIYNARVAKGKMGKVDLVLFRQSVKQHFKIVKYTYPSDSINIIASNILPILAIIYFAKAEVGIFAMAFKILATPLVLLSSSISRVYFQKSVTLFHHDIKQLQALTYRIIFSNVGIILLFLIFINTVGIYILDLLLKDDWSGLSEYILILSFWIFARSAVNPIITILMVIKKNHYSLIFNCYLLIVNFVAIYLGVMKQDFMYCITVFSVLSGIGYLILLSTILLALDKIKNA